MRQDLGGVLVVKLDCAKVDRRLRYPLCPVIEPMYNLVIVLHHNYVEANAMKHCLQISFFSLIQLVKANCL